MPLMIAYLSNQVFTYMIRCVKTVVCYRPIQIIIQTVISDKIIYFGDEQSVITLYVGKITYWVKRTLATASLSPLVCVTQVIV